MIFVLAIMTAAMSLDPNGPPAIFMVIMWVFFIFFTALMTIPSILAGYALRKQKPWARTMSIIAGVMASMSAPIGTFVCVYTFWFLFSEPGKVLYDNPQRMLPHEREAPWNVNASSTRKEQYVATPPPPDWR